MPKPKINGPQSMPDDAFDMPAFSVVQRQARWQVHITWPDGEEGPAIDFVSRADAETWILRDAHDWLVRLNAIDRKSARSGSV